MRRVNSIMAGLAFLSLALSCSREEDFVTGKYVAFRSVSYSVRENAGTLEIPLEVFNPDGKEVYVTLRTIDGTAVYGTDYTIEGLETGVLRFGSETSRSIVVHIIPHLGLRTDAVKFSLRIEGVSDGAGVSGAREVSVTILDVDHPLYDLLGTWTLEGTDYGAGEFSFEMHLESDESDDSMVWADYVCPLAKNSPNEDYRIYGIVSANRASITFPQGQVTGNGSTLYDFIYRDGSIYRSGSSIVFTKVEDGKYETATGYMFVGTDGYVRTGGLVYGEVNGYKTTITKRNDDE